LGVVGGDGGSGGEGGMETPLGIILRCPICWREFKFPEGSEDFRDFRDHIVMGHSRSDVAEDTIKVLERSFKVVGKEWEGIVEEIQNILKENLEYGMLRGYGAFINVSAIYSYYDSIVKDLIRIGKENRDCGCLSKLLDNSYYSFYYIGLSFRPIEFLASISAAGDAGGGLEGLALFSRQVVEELEVALVLDLHREFRRKSLEEKLEKHDEILNNKGFIESGGSTKRLSEYLRELVFEEKLEYMKQIPEGVARKCRNLYNLLGNVYKMLSGIVHSTMRIKGKRLESGSLNLNILTSFWDSELDSVIMINILAAVIDVMVAVHHTWMRKFIARAREECRGCDVKSPWGDSEQRYMAIPVYRFIDPSEHCYELESE
jgi:DNA-binding Lrp family transcriptional regulator